jgi:predicted nucleotidyltransferase
VRVTNSPGGGGSLRVDEPNRRFEDRGFTIKSLMTTRVTTRIPIPYAKIEEFCRKWNITRFEVFGSVLRDDFEPNRSDVDVLVTFAEGKTPGLEFFGLPDELEKIFGRPVDVSTRRSIEQSHNRIRKQAILGHTQTIYESR